MDKLYLYKNFFIDQFLDRKLNVSTQGYIKLYDRKCYNNCESTPYIILDRLFLEEKFSKNDYFVDMGSGLGRVLFYANYKGCPKLLGIEKDKQIFEKLEKNLENYFENIGLNSIELVNDYCEKLNIRAEMNKFFFFNPFDITIFDKVINKISDSLESVLRKIKLYLYYPTKEYIEYLEKNQVFYLEKIIKFEKFEYNIYVYVNEN